MRSPEVQKPINQWQKTSGAGIACLILFLVTGCSPTDEPQLSSFRDCEGCPPMIIIPPLDQTSRASRILDLGGGRRGQIENLERFAITETPVTFEQWKWYRCTASGACRYRPEDFGWGRGDRPIIYKTWSDIGRFISWLNAHTGQTYRLPTEAEWEFAARAGVSTEFSTGNCISTDDANFAGTIRFENCETGVWRQRTTPVNLFSPNEWGVYGVHGNVWELVDECWTDDSVLLSAEADDNPASGCEFGIGRGGAWTSDQSSVGFSARTRIDLHAPNDTVGFRLVRILDPADFEK